MYVYSADAYYTPIRRDDGVREDLLLRRCVVAALR
jgi:hypothetical protein